MFIMFGKCLFGSEITHLSTNTRENMRRYTVMEYLEGIINHLLYSDTTKHARLIITVQIYTYNLLVLSV